MTYESVVTELFERFPKLQSTWESEFDYMAGETKIQYIVFGSLLIPALDMALSEGNLGVILPVCAFLEDVAEAAQTDRKLENLLNVEVGEWLGWMKNEAQLAPWLGSETKRICRYVPGLATQRLMLKADRQVRSLRERLKTLIARICRR
jgi:hypothetical protein